YVLQGEGHMWYGEDLAEHLTVKAGEYLYIPAGVPHLPYNPSATETAVAVVARTDPNEAESVVLLPALDAVH
ncbi:MAG TPA: cupin domain-containing protein, partial [Caldilineaceae bacterium]|nr:cupin domain-containing protein [Caldilineaceae bacterium]